MVVDDGDPAHELLGNWPVGGLLGGYGQDYHFNQPGSGNDRSTWQFRDLPIGTYEVLVTWLASTGRASNAPYSLYAPSLVRTAEVNQLVAPQHDAQRDGVWFESLGTVTVDSGGTLDVVLSDNANGIVIADAVWVRTSLEPADTLAPEASLDVSDITIGGGSTYTFTVQYTDNVAVAVSSLDNADVRVTGPNGFSQVATFVSVDTNTDGTPRTATYRINTPGGSWDWRDNGTYTVSMLSGQVRDTSDNFVAAGDLGSFSVTVPLSMVIDDGDAGHVLVGSWPVGGMAGGYGQDYHYNLAGTGSDRSTWQFPDLPAGTYEILVTWLPNSGRASNAPYSLYAPTLVRTEQVNQLVAPQQDAQLNGVWFESLGTVSLDSSGAVQVVLTDNANGIVIADAVWVRFVEEEADIIAPEAMLDVSDITIGGGSTYTFTVQYTDNVAVAVSSLDNADVRVTGPNGFSQVATFVSVDTNTDGTPRTATYRINTPGGSWDWRDNGTYTVSMLSGQVRDTSDNFVAAGDLGSFSVTVPLSMVIDDGDAGHVLVGSWPVGGMAGGYGQDYHYNLAGTGSDRSTWQFPDLPAGTYEILVTWLPNPGRASNAPYSLYAPTLVRTEPVNQLVAPQQDAQLNGVWFESLGTVSLNSSGAVQVVLTDNANGIVIADAVWVRFVEEEADTIAPEAMLDVSDITIGGESTYTFTVQYTDNVAVAVSSLDNADVRVTGPNGFSQVATFVSVDTNTDGTPRTATYRINTPGGSWDWRDNGTYTVSMLSGQVRDTSDNFVAAGDLGSFSVTVPLSMVIDDGDAGNVLVGSWPVGGMAGGYGQDYHYNLAGTGSDRSTWQFPDLPAGTYEILVTWLPNSGRASNAPYSLYAPTLVRTEPVNQLVAPQQDAQLNGVWFESLGTVSLNSSGAVQVVLTDNANGIVIADAVWVRFVEEEADTIAPEAMLDVSDITIGGESTYTFTVQYTDNVAVAVSSLDNADVRVTGPNGFSQVATFVSVDTNTDGTPRTATYRINTPGGSWDWRDNGTYTVSMLSGQVRDTSDNFVAAGDLGSFSVTVPLSMVIDDGDAGNVLVGSWPVGANGRRLRSGLPLQSRGYGE